MKLASLMLAGLAVPALSQTLESADASIGPSGRGQVVLSSFRIEPPATPEPPVLNAPFSADELTVWSRPAVNPGDAPQYRESRARVFRDAQGRVRRERPLYIGPDFETPPMLMEITDPVAGVQYTIDPGAKIAHRSALHPAKAQPEVESMIRTAVRDPGQQARSSGPYVEQLEPREIDGLQAHGMRSTITIPAIGRDERATTTTAEVWTSRELSLPILVKELGLAGGEKSVRLMNITRGLPAPGLFEVPAGYSVREQTGGFRITATFVKP